MDKQNIIFLQKRKEEEITVRRPCVLQSYRWVRTKGEKVMRRFPTCTFGWTKLQSQYRRGKKEKEWSHHFFFLFLHRKYYLARFWRDEIERAPWITEFSIELSFFACFFSVTELRSKQNCAGAAIWKRFDLNRAVLQIELNTWIPYEESRGEKVRMHIHFLSPKTSTSEQIPVLQFGKLELWIYRDMTTELSKISTSKAEVCIIESELCIYRA